MRILLVGGSGVVGTLVVPHMKQGNVLRVLDPVPPRDTSVEFVRGSVSDLSAVRAALDGMDGVAYMALGRKPDGSRAVDDIDACYDLSVKGLHHVLAAAREAGITRAVYASTVSVHGSRPGGRCPSEDMPADSTSLYGFTKWLGELVCQHFVRAHGMNIVSLRLNGPMTREEWQKACSPGKPNANVAAPDVATAFQLALTAPVTGFHTLFISGDYEGKLINCTRAKEVLGWEAKERPEKPKKA